MSFVDLGHALGWYGTHVARRTWNDDSDVAERYGLSQNLTQNQHGVWGVWSRIGSMYQRRNRTTGRNEIDAPLFVPEVCWRCVHLDHGDYGDYGTLLAGPVCTQHVYLPTRMGRCGKMEGG